MGRRGGPGPPRAERAQNSTSSVPLCIYTFENGLSLKRFEVDIKIEDF